MRFLFVVLLTFSSVSTFSVALQDTQTTPSVSVSAFSRLPAYEDIDLSPKGTNIAFLQNFVDPKPLTLLRVLDLKTAQISNVFQSDNEGTKLNWMQWVNEDVLLISARIEVEQNKLIYYETRLLAYDLSDKKPELKRIIRQRKKQNYSTDNYASQFQDSVIDYLPNDPDHVLVEVDFDVQFEPSVYKLNVRSGKMKRIERGKLKIRNWYTDQQNVVRIGRARNYNTGKITYYYRESEKDKFEVFSSFKAFEDQPISIKGFGLDSNILYYTRYDNNTSKLFKLDLKTNKEQMILGYDEYDVTGSLIYSPKTNDAIGIYDPHSDYGRHFFDPKHYGFHKAISKAFPDTNNYLMDMSNDEKIYIVMAESSETAPIYFYGDRNTKKVGKLFSQYPELDGITLPKSKGFSYTARDGVEIEALLTLPTKGEAPYPLVVHPHGGPGARDFYGFDPWVAYMANKGYAVVRPNFRGSTGYGWAFAQAQMGRWGLEMQDDVTDAAQYLVTEGIADADRMCIFGASYGGYAAAMATVKTPEMFKCAVSFAGVFDLNALASNQKRFLGGRQVVENQIGDSRKDRRERSPHTHVEKISTPLLLLHGDNDPIVPVAQSRKFAKKLENDGKNVRYVELKDGDHYLSIQQNRIIFFEELDAFLDRYLSE